MVLLTALVLSVEAIEALRPSRWAGCQGLMEWPGVPGFSGAGPPVLSQIPTPIVACCLDTCSCRHSSSRRGSLAWPGRGRLLASLGFGRAAVLPVHRCTAMSPSRYCSPGPALEGSKGWIGMVSCSFGAQHLVSFGWLPLLFLQGHSQRYQQIAKLPFGRGTLTRYSCVQNS